MQTYPVCRGPIIGVTKGDWLAVRTKATLHTQYGKNPLFGTFSQTVGYNKVDLKRISLQVSNLNSTGSGQLKWQTEFNGLRKVKRHAEFNGLRKVKWHAEFNRLSAVKWHLN